MDKQELQNHSETLKLIEKDLHFAQTNEAVVEDENDK
jgi:hypothetical protein